MKTRIFGIVVLLIFSVSLQSNADEITPAGKRLAETLDSLHVEKLWLVGRRVDWRTGEPEGEINKKYETHTHCSAFAAAAADKIGVYLLHPPEHSTVLLANAQQDWLRGKGTNQGWRAIDSPVAAQHLANQGELVVVTFKNSDPKVPGHIAIVRPSEKSEERVKAEGPQVTQAGRHNYVSTNAKEGFKNHVGAFEKGELLYFVHSVTIMDGQQ
jgi:hypothetical protein